MNSRFTKGLIYGGLIGAAIGAYWMLRTDGAAKLMLEKQGRRARQMARATNGYPAGWSLPCRSRLAIRQRRCQGRVVCLKELKTYYATIVKTACR